MFLLYSALTGLSTLALYLYISPALSAKYSATYNNLPLDKRAMWNNKLTSLCFATVFSILTTVALQGHEVRRDIIWGVSPLTPIHSGLLTGYMIADIIIMGIADPTFSVKKAFLLHHIVSMVPALMVMLSETCAYINFYKCLAEWSNILLYSMWFSEVVHGKSSKIYLLVASLFTTSFILCRIAVLPFFYHQGIMAISKSPRRPPLYTFEIGCFFSIIFDVINIYWTYYLVKGLKKILQRELKQLKIAMD